MSISISLIAVLIPLLLMGGIIGRLFREFAVTLAMTIFVSLRIADADADDGVALSRGSRQRPARQALSAQRARLRRHARRLSTAASISCCAGGLPRCCVFFVTLGLSVYLFVIIPKGFFPQQDTGLILGTSEAAQDISFDEMKRKQEELGGNRDGRSCRRTVSRWSIGGGGSALNNGRMYITLKPRDERDASAQQIIARLRPKLDKVEGARALSAGRAGRSARRPRDAHAVRIHASGRQS